MVFSWVLASEGHWRVSSDSFATSDISSNEVISTFIPWAPGHDNTYFMHTIMLLVLFLFGVVVGVVCNFFFHFVSAKRKANKHKKNYITVIWFWSIRSCSCHTWTIIAANTEAGITSQWKATKATATR